MNDPATILKESELSGLRLAVVDYSANMRLPLHSHAEIHFCLALYGRCFESCDGITFEHERFTASFLPAGVSHEVNYGDDRFRWLSMIVDSGWVNRFNGIFQGSLNPTHSRGGQLNELFLRVYREFRDPDTMSQLVIDALACEMFAEVARYKTQYERAPPRWLFAARDYLEANVLEHIKLAMIAEAVDTHPVHLAREFRRYFNCTVGEYIRKKRVEFVRRELVGSDSPLVEIALAAGFCDQSHLTRTFKNVVGITPAQYRMMSNRSDHSHPYEIGSIEA